MSVPTITPLTVTQPSIVIDPEWFEDEDKA
jgi:hypothetical protein